MQDVLQADVRPVSVSNFRAMGSECRIVVDTASANLLGPAESFVRSLEQRWSRFLDSSEVSALNRSAGWPVVVSPETFRLLKRAKLAMTMVEGLFNPLMLDQIQALGYDRTWDAVDTSATPSSPPPPPFDFGADGDQALTLIAEASMVCIPHDTRFDPGGIGKGLAADLTADFCRKAGATTVSVELGGDLRVAGLPWWPASDGSTQEAWVVGITDPLDPSRQIASFRIEDLDGGAVATSTTSRRRWRTDQGDDHHHLLDPATGLPANGGVLSVSTCSKETWWAEVAAKAALIAGADRAVGLLQTLGLPGVVVFDDGRTESVIHAPASEEPGRAGPRKAGFKRSESKNPRS